MHLTWQCRTAYWCIVNGALPPSVHSFLPLSLCTLMKDNKTKWKWLLLRLNADTGEEVYIRCDIISWYSYTAFILMMSWYVSHTYRRTLLGIELIRWKVEKWTKVLNQLLYSVKSLGSNDSGSIMEWVERWKYRGFFLDIRLVYSSVEGIYV